MPQLMPLYWMISGVMFVFMVFMFFFVYSYMLMNSMENIKELMIKNEKWWW